MADWISTRNFSEGIDIFERTKIMKLYADDKWDYAKKLLGGRQRITRNGIIIAKKAKEQLDIDLFPMIFITAAKGHMDAGCAVFMMCGENTQTYLFSQKTTKYAAKKAKYEEYIPYNTQETYIEIIQ